MITQRSSKVVYQNPWMTVKEDEVEFAEGKTGIYGVVEKPDFALIVPFDGEKLYLVEQYRYPIRKYSWEFPQGSFETGKDLSAADMAERELREETGLYAGNIREVGYFAEAPGYSNQCFHIFFAKDITHGEQELEASEHGMKVQGFSLEEFEEKVRTGEIFDAPTVSAYALAKIHALFQ